MALKEYMEELANTPGIHARSIDKEDAKKLLALLAAAKQIHAACGRDCNEDGVDSDYFYARRDDLLNAIAAIEE